MNVFDVIYMSYEGIGERKFRFALNLIGILIGCAAVTGLVSLTQGMNANINDQLGVLGAETLMVLPESEGDMRFNAQSALNPIQGLTWQERKTLENIPGIDKVVEIKNEYGSITIKGDSYNVGVMGVGADFFDLNEGVELEDGRPFTRNDNAVAVIGANIAQPAKEDRPILEVGDRVIIKSLKTGKEVAVRVIGIAKKTGGIMRINVDEMIALPIRTVERFFDTDGEYTLIQVSVEDIDEVELIEAKIEDRLEDVMVISPQTAIDAMKQITGTIEAVLSGIAGISLLVAGIGIINTMTISVMERTREIGTMKAIGAKSSDILFLFITETMFTGVFGGFVGASLGFALSGVISKYIGLRTAPSLTLWLFVVGFAVFTCILSGIYPAWRASKLNPVEALRHE